MRTSHAVLLLFVGVLLFLPASPLVPASADDWDVRVYVDERYGPCPGSWNHSDPWAGQSYGYYRPAYPSYGNYYYAPSYGPAYGHYSPGYYYYSPGYDYYSPGYPYSSPGPTYPSYPHRRRHGWR